MFVGQRLRRIARRTFLTPNTIRYSIEYRCVKKAADYIGKCGVLLDAGAGSGEMSRRLLHGGFCSKLIALEPWEKTFLQLSRNLADYQNKELLKASLLDIPLDSQGVDCILSTQVLEHIEKHEVAVAEMSRVLKANGFAIISVPHPPEVIPDENHVRPGYTEEELNTIFSKEGFSLIFTEYFFTLPTFRRLIAAQELPFGGRFLPTSWADREKDLSNEQRAKLRPYGMLCLFRKSD